MRPPGVLPFSFALIAGLLACSLVEAKPPGRAEKIAEAQEHFRQGTTAYALGKYAEAATEWERAYELKPDAALLFNAAQVHRLGGNHKRALLLYQNYLRLHRDDSLG
jgi:tetratricopeptide (TPR) repeat protein